MSGERRPGRRTAVMLAGVAALLLSTASQAWDPSALLQDPLRVMPPVLQSDSRLAIAEQLPPCPPALAPKGPLLLDEAIDLALCHNPQLKSAWASIKVQAGLLGEARAAYLPSLNGSVSGLSSHTRYPATAAANTSSQGHTVFAGLSWRLLDAGGRDGNDRAATQNLHAALLSHNAALQKTLASVIAAYFDAQAADAVHQARIQAAQLAQGTLQTTQHREERGATGRSDTLQAATALARARLAEQRAQGDFNKAIAVLVYAIGLPAGAPLSVPQPLAPPVADTVKELDWWLEQALLQHPAIAAARAQWEAAQSKVDVVRSEGLPTLDLVANLYQNGYPGQSLQASRSSTTNVGVTLNIPLFEGFARNYKVRGALAQVEHGEAQLQETEHQVLGEVVKAHADVRSALANLDASQTLVESAGWAVQSSRNRYARGAADILELLTVQANLADAEQERIRCLSEWRSAQLRLLANVGVFRRGASSWPQPMAQAAYPRSLEALNREMRSPPGH